MSDGNYNRTHLPRHDFQSGVRAGRAAMRQKALEAFRAFVDERFPETPEEARRAFVNAFRQELS